MNGLYDITLSAGMDGMYVFDVTLNPAHAIFDGHFPGRPVLPGVCSMMMVRRCAALITGCGLDYASVTESKFLSAITPEARLTVKLHLTENASAYFVSATISDNLTVMLKLKATLIANE